jgi:hypothetical protein
MSETKTYQKQLQESDNTALLSECDSELLNNEGEINDEHQRILFKIVADNIAEENHSFSKRDISVLWKDIFNVMKL